MSELRVAIIGCGKIADQHAHEIRRVEGARLVAVCDHEKLMADQLAERFQVEGIFDDIDRLLHETCPDVVHITTPPQTHFELACKCLTAGSHVYVEKPFSVNYSEALSMISLAEQKNLRVTAGHNIQFAPEMIQMRELIRRGGIGETPVHVESIFSYSLADTTYLRAVLSDENHWVRGLPGKLLQNVISHGIAKVVEFLDYSGVTVMARGFTSPALAQAGGRGIIDELRVMICDQRNRTAYFTFTTQLSPPVQELRVFGTNGAIVVDNLHRTVVHLNRANSNFKSYLNFLVPPAKLASQYGRTIWKNVLAFSRAEFHMDAGMKNLIERFYRSILFGEPVPIPYEEILLTASVMDDIFRQLRSCASNGFAGEASRAVHTDI